MKKVVRIIEGQRVEGTLLSPRKAPKQYTVRPKPSKPIFKTKIPKGVCFS